MKKEELILVDSFDNAIGVCEKLEAHQKGLLHRAFSIFIFNERNELMMQQRAVGKYHSAGLWTNTCCGHPRPGENIVQAAQRRLKEEMGFSCKLTELFHFIYKSEFENGLTEHELDHVFVGKYNEDPGIDSAEAKDWKWMDAKVLNGDMKVHPDHYTVWLRKCFDSVMEVLNR